MKYVKTKEGEVVIFPTSIMHSRFGGLYPVSAGFCVIRTDRKKVDCFGESHSLNLESDVKKDSQQATIQLFGFDSLFTEELT